jgi:DNA-binding CsgD family transcriptional regulator
VTSDSAKSPDGLAIRAEKAAQARDLYAATFDLLNDEITGPQWLKKLGELANCRDVACIWWRAGHTDTARADYSGTEFRLSAPWFKLLDEAGGRVEHTALGLMDELWDGALKQLDDPADPLFTPERLIACLDWHPARVVIILSGRMDASAWQQFDRDEVNKMIPIIHKSIAVKKRLSWNADLLDLHQKVFDNIACGFISLMPGNQVISANRMAQEILMEGSCLQQKGAALELRDSKINSELVAELAVIDTMPTDQLEDYVWYRKLSGDAETTGVMATLLAFPLENWRTESTGHDRVAVMLLDQPASAALPSEAQLREFYQLTKAQARVLHALMRNVTIEQAAELLHISVNTARSHLRAIYTRLGVASKAQLMQMVSSTIGTSRYDK